LAIRGDDGGRIVERDDLGAFGGLGATVGCDPYDPAAASDQPRDLLLAVGVLRVFVVTRSETMTSSLATPGRDRPSAPSRARPDYPAELFDDLIAVAALAPGDRLLKNGQILEKLATSIS
jgi:hypothetical protein